MAEETADYDDIYIFSKDRRKQSLGSVNGGVSNGYSSINHDYVNLTDQRRIESEKYSQKSLPNLKQSDQHLYRRRIYSESDPLLGGNGYSKPRYICGGGGGGVHFKYKRTQIFLFFYVCFYVAYLIVGSVCFQKLEINPERIVRDEFRSARTEFLEAHPEVKGD